LTNPTLRPTTWIAALAIAAVGAPALTAQESPVPEKGTWTIGFVLPDGGGTSMGGWRMVSDRVLLGLEVDFQSSDSDTEPTEGALAASSEFDEKNFTLGPRLKLYLGHKGPVASYLRFGGGIGWSSDQQLSTNTIREQTTYQLFLRNSVGADWFPTEGISIGGYTGFQLTYFSARNVIDELGITQETWAIATFRSQLGINFWF
jgi:hypothetical protein